jgi:hypothetical protein
MAAASPPPDRLGPRLRCGGLQNAREGACWAMRRVLPLFALAKRPLTA